MNVTESKNNLSAIKDDVTIGAWLKTQRGRPQYRPSPSAGRATAKIIRPFSAKFGSGVTAIEQSWRDIAGQRFAKISRPVKISGGTSGRTLTIEAAGPAGALIQASSGPILDRLNTFLGYGQVTRIKILQRKRQEYLSPVKPAKRGLTPRQEQQLHSGLEKIKNIDLKRALEQLGRHAMAEVHTKPAYKETD